LSKLELALYEHHRGLHVEGFAGRGYRSSGWHSIFGGPARSDRVHNSRRRSSAEFSAVQNQQLEDRNTARSGSAPIGPLAWLTIMGRRAPVRSTWWRSGNSNDIGSDYEAAKNTLARDAKEDFRFNPRAERCPPLLHTTIGHAEVASFRTLLA
jgi:hypothetical protein